MSVNGPNRLGMSFLRTGGAALVLAAVLQASCFAAGDGPAGALAFSDATAPAAQTPPGLGQNAAGGLLALVPLPPPRLSPGLDAASAASETPQQSPATTTPPSEAASSASAAQESVPPAAAPVPRERPEKLAAAMIAHDARRAAKTEKPPPVLDLQLRR